MPDNEKCKTDLQEILKSHKKWLQDARGGERADLRGADLRGADLCDADLCYAYLSDADLRGANLSGANLRDADLRDAYLSGADLSGADLCDADLCYAYLRDANLRDANLRDANLCGANLRDADLRGAKLENTCLDTINSPYDWAISSGCDLRVCSGRVLVLASRTRNSPVMGGNGYIDGKLYKAPFFSRDPVTDCHPGLYIEGGPAILLCNSGERLLVACWLDEMHIVTKCRVPRFRTVATRAEFYSLKAKDLDE